MAIVVASTQAVRGAFPQGKPALPGSTFRDHTHVQVALRDNACIKGWFLPIGAALEIDEPLTHS